MNENVLFDTMRSLRKVITEIFNQMFITQMNVQEDEHMN